MHARRFLALLLSAIVLGAGAVSVQAQQGNSDESQGNGQGDEKRANDQGRGDDRNETDEDASELENDTTSGDGKGRDKQRDHPQNRTPQGRALGHDLEWHECRDLAGNNTTAKRECHDGAMARAIERHDAIKAARAEGRVGGEVNITDDNATIDADEGLEIEVQRGRNIAEPELRVQVGAEMGRGKTIILDVDPSLFQDNGTLVLRYWDVADDGSEVENRSFAPADNLQDVLNPDDDAGAEYYVISDHQGIHVMVSIDSWSVHALTVNSIVSNPVSSVVPTIVFAMLGAAFISMGVVLWWNRPGRDN